MITTKQPGSDASDTEPLSLTDSVIVVTLPDTQLRQHEMTELVAGAITAMRLLGLPELYLCGSAEQLPELAMAAAEVDDIPEGFQLCQIGTETGTVSGLPEGRESITKLSVDSLIRLTRAREAA